ncbi:MAG: Signal peptidase I [Candidatus Hydrogenedentes bacterium ADurb.Bin179]|nr:MAG: Signal peptidase I [Candidatus Hydrogenedentes bacterium ADurb.Bin179]
MTDTTTPSPRHPLRRFLESLTGPWTWRNLFGWTALVVAVLFVKGCLIDQYTIPSGSMEPTLKGDPRFFMGDRVLVNKWKFGPRIPFTTRRLWKWGAPDRWDIVVFRSIDPESEHPILIKRVIGLPGEKVKIRDGRILINGKVAEPPEELRAILHYVDKLSFTDIEKKRQLLKLAQANKALPILNPQHPPVIEMYAFMERVHPTVTGIDLDALSDEEIKSLCTDVGKPVIDLIDDIYDFVQPDMPYGIRDEEQYSVVPEGHYLLLGDNSEQSLDGRMYGWVPHHHLYGQAFAVWWPWSHRQDFTGFSQKWWGKLLLYGIPTLIVASELVAALRRRRTKDTATAKEQDL